MRAGDIDDPRAELLPVYCEGQIRLRSPKGRKQMRIVQVEERDFFHLVLVVELRTVINIRRYRERQLKLVCQAWNDKEAANFPEGK
jgi:hypothetical protein